ncbi:FAD-binding oxidoreductase [Luteimonas viscosa]|uniref:D-amino-acid oxidase n=1 Tax=Luteimonas viscosa TaxID=1132694 RepID=A0A5D4XQB1_9GAMM|nr:FAD-dependent oxidoreductase [Luteimonas viscosa]TYT26143.1 FAD-binding oxidoreductase [Luteimonas viscosa]
MRTPARIPAPDRRRFLRSAGWSALALSIPPALGGCASRAAATATDAAPAFAAPPPLAPIFATPDRIIAIDVCTRPFRAQGPRIEAERIGDHTIVHNYGHGGGGWSLSWGSAAEALRLVQATGERELAVVGCGAIGLTTALLAQRSGLQVRIYARERLPLVPSSFATGVWSPASRIAAASHATPAFEARWERMARTSFRTYQTLLGLPGEPVGWHDFYHLSDGPGARRQRSGDAPPEPAYADLESRLIDDLGPRSRALGDGAHPFNAARVRRKPRLVFNLATYSRLLLGDFLQLGGTIETRTFHSPADLATLREKTVVNATGQGARALFGDPSLVPVRGQTARLIPQPEVGYGLAHGGHNLFVVPRGDGILVQTQEPGDYDNDDTTPDPALSVAAVQRLAGLFQ